MIAARLEAIARYMESLENFDDAAFLRTLSGDLTVKKADTGSQKLGSPLDLVTRLRLMVAYCRDRDGVMDEPEDNNIPGLMEAAAIQIESLLEALENITANYHAAMQLLHLSPDTEDMATARAAIRKARGETNAG